MYNTKTLPEICQHNDQWHIYVCTHMQVDTKCVGWQAIKLSTKNR